MYRASAPPASPKRPSLCRSTSLKRNSASPRRVIAAAGLTDDQIVALESNAGNVVTWRREGIVTPHDIPRGCLGAYYSESNVLMPTDHHAEKRHVPAAKSAPVRIAPISIRRPSRSTAPRGPPRDNKLVTCPELPASLGRSDVATMS